MPNGSFKPLANTAICSGLASAADSAENSDVAGFGLGYENVAVGRGADNPWTVEVGRVLYHLEASRNLWPRAFRTGHDLRPIGRRGSGEAEREGLSK